MKFNDLHPNIRLRFGLQFVTTLANSMIMPFMVIFFSQKIGQTITGLVLATVLTKCLKSFADRRVLSLGMLMFTLGFAVLGFSTNSWILLSAMLIATIGEVMYIPVKQAILGDLIPEDARSSYMAVNNFGNMGAMMISSISVTISGFLSPLFMSGMFLAFGLTSVLVLRSIAPRVDQRRLYSLQREKVQSHM